MNSALKILEDSPSRLVIYASSHQVLGWVFLVLGIISVVITFLYMMGTRQWNWLGPLISLAVLAIGIGCLGSETRLTLSRVQGQVQIRERFFFVASDLTTIPMSDVRRAVVETTDFNRSLFLVTDANTIQVFGYTSHEGYHQAVDAINKFLGVSPALVPQAGSRL